MEQVSSFRFLGVASNLTWSSTHITTLVKIAQKRLLRSKILVKFYTGAIESILTGNSTILHGLCSTQIRKTQQCP